MSIRVRHREYGEGTVIAWHRGGRSALVDFDERALPLEVLSRDLDALGRLPAGGAQPKKGEPPAAAPRASAPIESEPQPAPDLSPLTGTRERVPAAMVVEAMRLGVVPEADLSAYTVGREVELSVADELLEAAERGIGGTRAFLGDYGTGKTHLLELIQQRALANGFLSSLVMLDAKETTPSHPRRVYRAIIRNLRYPGRTHDEAPGLAPLLDEAVASAAARRRFAVGQVPAGSWGAAALKRQGLHLYLTPALERWSHLAELDHGHHEAEAGQDLVEAWISGHPTLSNSEVDQELRRLGGTGAKLYSLQDYRPWARIYGYLLTGLSVLARELGYKGLVVLLDEAEFYSLLGRGDRDFARHLFRTWVAGARGSRDLDADTGVGGQGIQRRLPPFYHHQSGLSLVLAMTPNPSGLEVLYEAVGEDNVWELSTLGKGEFAELVRRVADFYASAYPEHPMPGAVVGALTKVVHGLLANGQLANPRAAMKLVVDFLDIARLEPKRVPGVVRRLQQELLF